jgi:uncharacterized membrane protein (UPF0127 family)
VTLRTGAVAAACAALAALGGCHAGGAGPQGYCATAPGDKLPVLIESAKARHCFAIERASTTAEQAKGLMFRTDLSPDGGMLFWPYPAGGGAAQDANFWMKNTPTALDIVFIRADGTIARIAENTVPFSEDVVPSGEPVTAVLELVGGRTAALGIEAGDKVSWPGR